MKGLRVILLGCLWMMGCGALPETGEDSPMIQVPIALNIKQSVLDTLDKISLTVTGPGMATLTKDLTPPFTSPVAFNVSVPTGSDRIFTVKSRVTEDFLIGYQGSITSDVASSGGTVTINLQYINFALDGSSDTVGQNQIDISTFEFGVNTNGTSVTTDDRVMLDIDFVNPIPTFLWAVVIEVDTDAKSTTGSTRTRIDKLRGSLASGFSAGSELYLVVEDTFQGVVISLFDGNDASVSLPQQTSALTATLDTSHTLLTVSIDLAVFKSLIDADGVGHLNILTGTKVSSTPLLLPDFTGFSTDDILISSTTVPTVKYQIGFDLSGL